MAYLSDVDRAPIQPVNETLTAGTESGSPSLHPSLLDELWRECGAGEWGLGREECDRIILFAGMSQNFGVADGAIATTGQQTAFFKNVKLAELVLAKACAAGNERAWEHFMALYSQPLTRAAVSISGSETVGKDLADAFYAELYGLTSRDGQRKCPLDSYAGRGSLLGWLRTTLAQRFVDHYRRTYREESLEDRTLDPPIFDSAAQAEPATLELLGEAVQAALRDQDAEERFLLAVYYVDGQTLAEIGKLLLVHEATVSRRLRRATEAVRKRLLRNLVTSGMGRRAAEELLGTDPRDVDLKMDLKKLLQISEPEPFSNRALTEAVAGESIAGVMRSDRTEVLSKAGESLSQKAKNAG